MQLNRITWMAAVLSTAAVTSLVGCAKNDKASDMGAATINVHQALTVTDVGSVAVSVASVANNVNLTIPLVSNATKTQWSALVSSLPVGSDYVFTASARDSTNIEIYHGSVSGQTIVKGQTASIVIDMNQVAPAVGLENEAPVIDSLTATAVCVSRDDTVIIRASAHDPDAGDTLGMTWVWGVDSSCGTLGPATTVAGSNTVQGTSQVTFTATSSSANCQVNVTVNDARLPAYLQTSGSVTIQLSNSCAFGNAKITAIPNTCPIIGDLRASTNLSVGSYVPMQVGKSTNVTVSATDVDGDTLIYAWTSPDCAGGTPATTFGVWNDSQGKASTWFLLNSTPPSGTCTFLVDVSDGTFADGKPKCTLHNHLSLPVFGQGDVVKANPVFGFDYQSQDLIGSGDQVNLEIVAPTLGCTQPYTLVWSPALPALTPLSAPFTTGVVYTAPTGAENTDTVQVTVTATCPSSSLSTTHTFTMHGTNAVCALAGVQNGDDCTSTAQSIDKCVLSATCQGGSCVPQNVRSCTLSTTVCQDNKCAPSTGLCGLVPQTDGAVCADGLACTTGDHCAAGQCTGTQTPCASSTNSCQVNACAEPSGTCQATNRANNTPCDDGLACTTGDVCTVGTCGGNQTTCNPGFACYEPTPGCLPIVCMQPSYAREWFPVTGGMTVDGNGTLYATGGLYGSFDFGNGSISSQGSSDAFLVRVDPATGLAQQSFAFGDPPSATSKKDQSGTGVAVAGNGNIAVIGTFGGEIDFTGNASDGSGTTGNVGVAGVDFLTSGSAIPYYGIFNASSSGQYVTPVLEHMVGVGTGALLAVASNPAQNYFAICGKTSIAVTRWNPAAATSGVITGSTAGPAGGGLDIIVALIDATTGIPRWGRQYGNAGDQICNSVALDSSGNVYITGNWNGTITAFGTAFAGPVASTTSQLYAARLAFADGSVQSAATWTSTGRSNATSVAVDATGNVILGGTLGSAITFSPSTVNAPYFGGLDAFVVKLNSSLVAQWANTFGDANYDQLINSVSVLSSGNVVAGGNFQGTVPQVSLTASSNTAPDAFVVQMQAADGVPNCAHQYGDALGSQGVNWVQVANAATGSLKDATFVGGPFTSAITFGSTTLNTGSPSLTHTFVTRMTP